MTQPAPDQLSPSLSILLRLTDEIEGVPVKVSPLALARACLMGAEEVDCPNAAAELRTAALACIEAARDGMLAACTEAREAELRRRQGEGVAA